MVHQNKLLIEGYVKTNKGVELKYKYIDSINKKKKYSDELIDKIIYLKDENTRKEIGNKLRNEIENKILTTGRDEFFGK